MLTKVCEGLLQRGHGAFDNLLAARALLGKDDEEPEGSSSGVSLGSLCKTDLERHLVTR